MDSVRAIIFSKDRPFQLRECLRTLRECLIGSIKLEVHVLVKIDGLFRLAYSEVADRFPDVKFHEEQDFANDFINLVTDCPSQQILFSVDDTLWLGKLDVQCMWSVLHQNPHLSAIQLKLWPGVMYCHSAGAACQRPLMCPVCPGSPFLEFRLGEGSHDWDYPFDLCGTLYRKCDLLAVINWIQQSGGVGRLGHPNTLEVAGSQAWRSANPSRTHSAGVCVRVMTVITVNRVQEKYQNPVYSGPTPYALVPNSRAAVHSAGTCRTLLSLATFDKNRYTEVDCLFYLGQAHNCVHVGPMVTIPPTIVTYPQVSVLMPVRNCEKYVGEAIRSVLCQSLSSFELIVVDDGSTDSTGDIVRSFMSDRRVRLLSDPLGASVGFEIPPARLSRVLNAGLRECRGELIARADGDDVCHEERLARQAAFMLCHDRCAVVGSAVEVFYEGTAAPSARIIVHPQEPAMVRLHMLLYCCVAHPSAMIRASALVDVGGYGESNEDEVAEDHALWLAMQYPKEGSHKRWDIHNLGDVLVRLRKHSRNISSLRAEAAMRRSSMLCADAVNNLIASAGLGDSALATPELIHLLMTGPSSSSQHDVLVPAARLLQEIEKALQNVGLCSSEVTADVSSRVGEIAAACMRRVDGGVVPPEAAALWRTWLSRNPRRQLASLLQLR